ncbi:MAG: SDR family NAD(P)-dependent oxidoreductase [Cellulomonas sp.]|nr:SDR family NAD(P)-dependent oxidoreductase [Cellulomonas sp.]
MDRTTAPAPTRSELAEAGPARRVALVTGATSGIGAATALELAWRGLRVVVLGRDEERGAGVVGRIRASGGEAALVTADLCDDDALASALDAAAAVWGRLDHAFNNAGVAGPGTVADADVEDFDRAFAVNTRAVAVHARGGAPHDGHRRRLDRQQPVRALRAHGVPWCGAVRRVQGGGPGTHPLRRGRAGRPGHPRQRRRVRPGGHRDVHGPRHGAARRGRVEHAAAHGPRGHHGRGGGRGRVAVLRRGEVRHRQRHRRGRRVPGALSEPGPLSTGDGRTPPPGGRNC